jgi:hypothetical protein
MEMSIEITTAMVEQYSANWQMLSQQRGSKLRGAVRVESVTGKNAFFDQIGVTEARQRPSRHADTPRMDTPHSRRRVSLVDYDWADLIDKEDEVRLLTNPSSAYAMAAAFAMGRAMDDAIIDAATGTAYTGVAGGTSTAFDTTNNVVDVQVRASGVSAADLGLNVAKLIAAKKILDGYDVDEAIPRFIAWNARQMASLLADTRASSGDYNTIKALVRGEIDTYLGFKFLRTERIDTDSNSDDKVLFWAQDGILLGTGMDVVSRISERDDKNYATQVFASMSIGATRMEEKKVGYIECDPSAGPG